MVAPAMEADVLCVVCAGPVQLSWGLYTAGAPQRSVGRWSTVHWDGRRREVLTISTAGDYL